jgi:hypothetical protein
MNMGRIGIELLTRSRSCSSSEMSSNFFLSLNLLGYKRLRFCFNRMDDAMKYLQYGNASTNQ